MGKKKLVLGLALSVFFFFAGNTAYALGPLSTYCRQWNQCVDSKWRAVAGFEESSLFYVHLDSFGRVLEIREDRGMPPAKKQMAHRFISSLKGLPKPPQRVPSPFWIEVYLCNDLNQSLVRLYNLNWNEYMEELQRSVKQKWMPPKSKKSNHATVRFSVDSNGKLSDLVISKSTGNLLADQAALDAVRKAAPFKPLLDGAEESVDVEFTLDYNVHKNSNADTSGAVIRHNF